MDSRTVTYFLLSETSSTSLAPSHIYSQMIANFVHTNKLLNCQNKESRQSSGSRGEQSWELSQKKLTSLKISFITSVRFLTVAEWPESSKLVTLPPSFSVQSPPPQERELGKRHSPHHLITKSLSSVIPFPNPTKMRQWLLLLLLVSPAILGKSRHSLCWQRVAPTRDNEISWH